MASHWRVHSLGQLLYHHLKTQPRCTFLFSPFFPRRRYLSKLTFPTEWLLTELPNHRPSKPEGAQTQTPAALSLIPSRQMRYDFKRSSGNASPFLPGWLVLKLCSQDQQNLHYHCSQLHPAAVSPSLKHHVSSFTEIPQTYSWICYKIISMFYKRTESLTMTHPDMFKIWFYIGTFAI